MDIFEAALNKGILVLGSGSTLEISHVSEVAPNKATLFPEIGLTLIIGHPKNFYHIKYQRR